MKIPKLKYWCLAMAAGNYADFERSRKIVISPQATIDVATGQITGQTQVYLCDSVIRADDHYRDLFGTKEDLYVLRIPADCVDRRTAVPTAKPGVWIYRQSLHIPHCGVELVNNKS